MLVKTSQYTGIVDKMVAKKWLNLILRALSHFFEL